MIIKLNEKVDNQEKEIDQLKKRVNELEKKKENNEINQYSSDNPIYNLINNDNNNYKNYNSNSNNKYNNRFNNNNYGKDLYPKNSLLRQSNLIKNEIEEMSIKNWIHGLNNKISFKLLFRMSINGRLATQFHYNCDNKGKTLFIIETDENIRIGGYTPISWNMDQNKYGENFWLINFKQMFITPILYQDRNKRGGMICNMNYGPSFLDFLVIKNNDLTKGYIENEAFFKECGLKTKSFNIKEIEVFQVKIKYN